MTLGGNGANRKLAGRSKSLPPFSWLSLGKQLIEMVLAESYSHQVETRRVGLELRGHSLIAGTEGKYVMFKSEQDESVVLICGKLLAREEVGGA